MALSKKEAKKIASKLYRTDIGTLTTVRQASKNTSFKKSLKRIMEQVEDEDKPTIRKYSKSVKKA